MTLCSSFPSSSCSALFSGGRLYRSKEEFFLLRGEEFRRNQFDGRLREIKKCGEFSSVLLSQQQQQSCCFERDFRVRVVLYPFAFLATSVAVDYYCGGSFAGLNCINNKNDNKGRTRTRDLGFGVKCRVGSAVRDLETEDSAREDGIGSQIWQEDEDEENIHRISSSSGVQLASGRRSEVAGETDGDFVLGSTNGTAQNGAYCYGDGDDSQAAGGGGGGILNDAISRLVQEVNLP